MIVAEPYFYPNILVGRSLKDIVIMRMNDLLLQYQTAVAAYKLSIRHTTGSMTYDEPQGRVASLHQIQSPIHQLSVGHCCSSLPTTS